MNLFGTILAEFWPEKKFKWNEMVTTCLIHTTITTASNTRNTHNWILEFSKTLNSVVWTVFAKQTRNIDYSPKY